jgi:hypothetical protein
VIFLVSCSSSRRGIGKSTAIRAGAGPNIPTRCPSRSVPARFRLCLCGFDLAACRMRTGSERNSEARAKSLGRQSGDASE